MVSGVRAIEGRSGTYLEQPRGGVPVHFENKVRDAMPRHAQYLPHGVHVHVLLNVQLKCREAHFVEPRLEGAEVRFVAWNPRRAQ